jgi:hypothetical protein
MRVTGFGGHNLNFKRFEENHKSINIDAWEDIITKNLEKNIYFTNIIANFSTYY